MKQGAKSWRIFLAISKPYKALFYRFHKNPYDSYFCMCRVFEAGDQDAICVLVDNIEPVPLGVDPGKYYVNLKYLLDKYNYSVEKDEDENDNENEETWIGLQAS